jgi:hypothetical protein
MTPITKNQKGSIALITILVVSAILLIVVLGASESQITTSYQYLNTTSNKSTYYFAESCLEEAMGQIKIDENYSGNTVDFTDDNASCDIDIAGDNINITVNYENYTQDYQAEISISTNGEANNVRLLNWEKI